MSIIVQKFGGTSVADSDKILAAARKAIRAKQDGNQVVMVVSAMGKNTDMLVDLAQQITEEPPAREMDMLLSTGEQVSVALMAMAIHSLGHEAISMTGAQIGIKTDSSHTRARIQSIATDRMREALDAGKIVIAAGFQGVDKSFNITTLGRGGSDTTAVALAAVLGADACEIHTDVDGIYTTDPRILPEARRVSQISYDEMLELASAGAGVMHNRSIEFAKKFSVPVHVRSSFTDSPGTMIVATPESPDLAVCGAAIAKNEARITVNGVPDRPGAALAIFSKISSKNVAMDMIVQNAAAEGRTDISFTVFRDNLPTVLKVAEEAVEEVGAEGFSYDDNVSQVSVVGLGMAARAGVAQKMFDALGRNGINILMISTSGIKISVLVSHEQAGDALRVVHEVFELDKEPTQITSSDSCTQKPPAIPADVVARMQGMEDLIIENISLDDTQARITIMGVPDKPGLAVQVFEEIANEGIVVDMIVQSFGRDGHANLGFTFPQKDLEKATKVAGKLAKQLDCPLPICCPKIAKLSVSGTALRSHTSVASRMFKSLATANINVSVISTSEVCINVIIDGDQGAVGLATLKKEFNDVLLS